MEKLQSYFGYYVDDNLEHVPVENILTWELTKIINYQASKRNVSRGQGLILL